MIKIKIVSDGNYGTRVLNAVTGEMLDDVVSVQWQNASRSGGGDHVATAHVTFYNVAAEVVADAETSCGAPSNPNLMTAEQYLLAAHDYLSTSKRLAGNHEINPDELRALQDRAGVYATMALAQATREMTAATRANIQWQPGAINQGDTDER